MTKADIAELISNRLYSSKREAAELVESVLELIKDRLERGDSVRITKFGNFEVKKKSDRRGRNPQTGEEITIEARRVLTWRPSLSLRRDINQ